MAVDIPTTPIGYVSQTYGSSTNTWWMYDGETTPELWWPQSITVYDAMRTQDAQVGSVLEAVVRPILRTPWRVDPAGARPEVVEFVADDLGLPIVGENPEPPPRTKDRFSWLEHLELALLMLPFGHSYFEQIYRVTDDGNRAHLGKLEPRMPKTIEKIDVARDGGLISITQWGTLDYGLQKPIPVRRLVAYIYKREGGNWLGRSILRQAYKNWLLKDRLLRVQAQTIERNGMGIPVATDAEGASPDQHAAGLAMAKALRAGEAAGVALPFGATLTLMGVSGTLPDAQPAIDYHDNQIARAVLAHFLNLGQQTGTGSYALGVTFADFFTASLQTLAQQIADVATQHIVEDLVDVNWGPEEPAPRITFDEIGSRQAATAQSITALINAGALTPDERLEESLRQQYGLPPKQVPDTGTDQPLIPEPAQPEPVLAGGVPKGADQPSSAPIDEHDDDEPGQSDDEDVDAIVAALAAFCGEVHAKAGPDFNELHPRGAGGRFRNVFARITRALQDWENGDSPSNANPFEGLGFKRDQLRDAAKKRGVTLRRGATEPEIVEALKADVRSKRAGAKAAKSPEVGKPVRFTLTGGGDANSAVAAPTRAFPAGQHSWSGHDGLDVTDEDEAKGLTETEIQARLRGGSAATAGGLRGTYYGTLPNPVVVVSPEREAEIRAAVEQVARQSGKRLGAKTYLTMQNLREGLAGRFDRAEVDNTIQKLNRSGDWYAAAESNQKSLTPRGRLAAVVIGNQDKHVIGINTFGPPANPVSAPKPDGKLRDLDVGVFHEGGKVSLWEVSDSGQRRRRIAQADDLAGLEKWADEHGESELAGWARKERGGAEVPKAPAKATKRAPRKAATPTPPSPAPVLDKDPSAAKAALDARLVDLGRRKPANSEAVDRAAQRLANGETPAAVAKGLRADAAATDSREDAETLRLLATEITKKPKVAPPYINAEGNLDLAKLAEVEGINIKRWMPSDEPFMFTPRAEYLAENPFDRSFRYFTEAFANPDPKDPRAHIVKRMRATAEAWRTNRKEALKGRHPMAQNPGRRIEMKNYVAGAEAAAKDMERLADAADKAKIPPKKRFKTLGGTVLGDVVPVDEGRFTDVPVKGGLLQHRGEEVPAQFRHTTKGIADLITEGQRRPGLTERESHALDLYTAASVADALNGSLRKGRNVHGSTASPHAGTTVDLDDVQFNLDSAINASELTQDTALWRGALPTKTDFNRLVPGAIYADGGYVSTSTDEHGARSIVEWRRRRKDYPSSRQPVLFKILAPAGTNGALGHERVSEVVLPRDQQFRVVRVDESGDVPVVVMEALARDRDTPAVQGRRISDEFDYDNVVRTARGGPGGQGGDLWLAEILREQGFDGRPTVLSPEQMDAVISKGGIELFRGVRGSSDGRSGASLAEAYRSGDLFPGLGVYGSGTYTATDRGVAQGYAGGEDSGVLRLALRRDARVIPHKELLKLRASSGITSGARRLSAERQKELEAVDPNDAAAIAAIVEKYERLGGRQSARSRVGADEGRAAALLGYDAISVDNEDTGTGYYVILNRTATYVQEAT